MSSGPLRRTKCIRIQISKESQISTSDQSTIRMILHELITIAHLCQPQAILSFDRLFLDLKASHSPQYALVPECITQKSLKSIIIHKLTPVLTIEITIEVTQVNFASLFSFQNQSINLVREMSQMISTAFKTSQQLYFAPNATLPFDHLNGHAKINPQNASALKRELYCHLVPGKTILALSWPPH